MDHRLEQKIALLLVSILIWLSTSCFPDLLSTEITSDAEVGVYFYAWYGNLDGTSGLSTRHWNDSALGAVVDKPVIGYYSSCNVTAVRFEIKKMAEAGIDFALISWSGPDDYSDDGVRTFLKAAEAEGWPIKFAILVEPYLYPDSLDFMAIYTYIKENFMMPYQDHYFKRNDGSGNLSGLAGF